MGMTDFDRTLKFSYMQDELASSNSQIHSGIINAYNASWEKVKAAFATATLSPVLA